MTTYTVTLDGTEVYCGTDLEAAIRTWDSITYNRRITTGQIEARSPFRHGNLIDIDLTCGRVYINPCLQDSRA